MTRFTEPNLCLIKAGYDVNTFLHKSQVCSLVGSPDGAPEHVQVVPICHALLADLQENKLLLLQVVVVLLTILTEKGMQQQVVTRNEGGGCTKNKI